MPNILDTMLNNQNTIMNNQATIMNKLNAITEALGKTPTVEQASPATVVEAPVTTTETPVAPTTPVTTDVSVSEPATEKKGLINEHGIPWNKEVHSGSQKCNNDGHWKAIKGVDKDKLAAYNAQFTGDTVVDKAPDIPAAPATPAAPAAPATPAAPAAPATPATPAAPATPATPAAPATPAVDESSDKAKAVKIISELTNDYKVPYLNITAGVVEKHGNHLIDAIPVEKHGEILADVTTWLEELQNINGDIDIAKGIDEQTGGEHSIVKNVFVVIKNTADVDDCNLVPFNKLAKTANEVEAFVKQWSDWFEPTK